MLDINVKSYRISSMISLRSARTGTNSQGQYSAESSELVSAGAASDVVNKAN